MIAVTVHLHTVLQRQTPHGLQRRLALNLPGGVSVSDLLALLEIDYPEALLVVVNGRRAETEQALRDGDEIHLVPPISGGAGALHREVVDPGLIDFPTTYTK